MTSKTMNKTVVFAILLVAILDAIAGLQTSVDGIDTSGLATQSSVDDISTALDNLQSDVDDIRTAQIVDRTILCGIATSPDCLGLP